MLGIQVNGFAHVIREDGPARLKNCAHSVTIAVLYRAHYKGWPLHEYCEFTLPQIADMANWTLPSCSIEFLAFGDIFGGMVMVSIVRVSRGI